jgi:hypothetical protein
MSAACSCSSGANLEALRAHLAVLESVYKFGVNAGSRSSSSSFDDATLANILSYVGPGHWLFLGPVSKKWCELYRELCAQFTREVRVDGAHCSNCAISSGLESSVSEPSHPFFRAYIRPRPAATCSSSTYTLFRSVVESGSRVGLARSYGCQIQNWCFVQVAAKHADRRALVKAHRHGMPLSSAAAEIAKRGDKDLLEWQLIHYHCGPLDHRIPAAAAESGSTELMAWLLQHGVALRSAEISTAAARSGSVPICELVEATPCIWREDALAAAVDGQHAELFAWLLLRRPMYEQDKPSPFVHNSMYRIYRVRLMRGDLAGTIFKKK